MQSSTLRRAAALGAAIAAMVAATAVDAQAPPPGYSEAGEIAACLCLSRSVSALSADLTARQQAYNAVRDELARLDAELERERGAVDVNNPQSVAQFRELLERRDGVFRRQRSQGFADLSAATERYNARSAEYNARCANRPRDPGLLARVEATLSCPPP